MPEKKAKPVNIKEFNRLEWAFRSLCEQLKFYGKKGESGFSGTKLEDITVEDQLIIAILLGSKEMVDDLIEEGVDVNAVTKKGYSMLELAEAYERKDIEEKLRASGADPRKGPRSPRSKK